MSQPDAATQPSPSLPKRSSYRSTTLIGSLAVFATILLLGLWVLVKPSTVGESEPAHLPRNSTDTGGSILSPGGFGAPTSDLFGRRAETPLNPVGAFLPQSGQTSTGDWSAPPAGLVWENVYGMPMPFSRSDGPTGITAEGVPVGFAHTPQGAALAAMHAGMRIMAVGPGNDPRALAAAMHLAQTDAARQILDRKINAQITPEQAHRWFAIPVGIKVTAYTGDYCQVQIASPTIGGQPSYSVTDLVWRDGAWKVVVPDSVLPDNQTTLSSLAGWNTEW